MRKPKEERKARNKKIGNWLKSLLPTALDTVSTVFPIVAPISAPLAKVSRKLIGVAPKAVNPLTDTKYDNITPKGEHNKTKIVLIAALSLLTLARVIFPEHINAANAGLIIDALTDLIGLL